MKRLLLLPLAMLTACDNSLQGRVHDIGDAIEHCRTYARKTLPNDVVISVDQLSTRENREYYEVFLNIQNRTRRGYAHCQIDMDGLIVDFTTPGFRQKGTGPFGL